MAYYWASGACRIDLLTATEAQIRASVACRFPWMSISLRNEEVADLLALQVQVRAANTLASLAAARLGEVIDVSGAALRSQLAALTSNAATNLGGTLNTVQVALLAAESRAKATEKSLLDGVLGGIGSLIGGAASTVGGLVDTVSGAVGDAATAAGGVIGAIATAVKDALAAAVSKALSTIGGVIGGVIGGIGSALGTVGKVIGDVTGAISGALSSILAKIGEAIGFLVNKLTGLPGALLDMADEIVAGVAAHISNAGQGLASFIADPVGGILGSFFGGPAPELVDRIEGLIARIERNPHTSDDLKRLTRPGVLPAIPLFGLIVAIALPSIIGGVITTLMQPELAKMTQAEMVVIRPSLLTLGDALAAEFRGTVTSSYVREVGAKLGYLDADMAVARELSRPLPGAGDVLEWRHRELLSEGATRELLAKSGYAAEHVELMVAGSELIPNVSDLVRFAVREAFPGQVAYDGPAGAGTPGGLVKAAKALGLSETWARSFWAAHWELPSVGQGFEMYQRRVINEQRLRSLLVQGDVMPEWRDALSAIAYNPLTRVDVRRMYDVGVLTAAQVYESYLDLGYSPLDAQRMAAFTVALADADQAAKPAPERDLTRADLVGAYADGILTRPVLIGNLIGLDYSRDEAELIADREDIRAASAARREVKGQVQAEVLAGLIDLPTAQDRLAAAGLTATEQALTVERIIAALDARVASPTRADLFGFYRSRLITDTELHDELAKLGYRAPWITRYVLLAKERNLPAERDLTKADLLGVYKAGLLTRAEVVSQLRTLGYDERETELLVDRVTVST